MEHQYKDTLTHFTISVGRSAGRCSTMHRRSRSTSWRTVTRGNMCARCAARRSSGRTTCEYRWTQFTSFLRQLINVDIVFLASVISKKKKKGNTVNDNSTFLFFFSFTLKSFLFHLNRDFLFCDFLFEVPFQNRKLFVHVCQSFSRNRYRLRARFPEICILHNIIE